MISKTMLQNHSFFFQGILRRHGLCRGWYDSCDIFLLHTNLNWIHDIWIWKEPHWQQSWKVKRWVADNMELQCCQKVFIMIVAIACKGTSAMCCPNMLSPDDKHSDFPKSTWVPHYIWLKLDEHIKLHHNSPLAYSFCGERNPQTLSRPPETKQRGRSKLVFSFPLHIGSLDVVTEYLPR